MPMSHVGFQKSPCRRVELKKTVNLVVHPHAFHGSATSLSDDCYKVQTWVPKVQTWVSPAILQHIQKHSFT